MSDTLKGLLIIASVLTVGWILRKIRKNKVKMEDAIFWIFFAAILLLLAIFPEISYELCRIFGIMSPSNLVFLVIIFLLVEKIFTLSIIVSQLNIYLIYYCISAGRQDWSVISRSCASFQG